MQAASLYPDQRLDSLTFPAFEPHPLLPGGHLQTLGGRYLPSRVRSLEAISTVACIDLEDGDQLCISVADPPAWKSGQPVALLVHGLAGCARSPYVVRVAQRLQALGIRAVSINLRGAGAGFGLARGIYHAGRTEDLRVVVRWIGDQAPGSPIALVGFSLGGNLVLKLAAEAVDDPLPGLDCVLAANPPVDLAACCNHIRRPGYRLYDRNFVRLLRVEVRRLHEAFPELGPIHLAQVRSLYDFDDVYTAPRNGFQGAADYYRQASSARLIPQIQLPGLVVHARDDPFIPAQSFDNIFFPSQMAMEWAKSGGHLGYVSRTRHGEDHRWLDARLSAWLSKHWNLQ